jgi:hemin uptake protein HemP
MNGNAALTRHAKCVEQSPTLTDHFPKLPHKSLMNDPASPSPEQPNTTPGGPPQDRPPTITSQQLLQGRRELWIDHEGEIYRLRITSRGKLYLTK